MWGKLACVPNCIASAKQIMDRLGRHLKYLKPLSQAFINLIGITIRSVKEWVMTFGIGIVRKAKERQAASVVKKVARATINNTVTVRDLEAALTYKLEEYGYDSSIPKKTGMTRGQMRNWIKEMQAKGKDAKYILAYIDTLVANWKIIRMSNIVTKNQKVAQLGTTPTFEQYYAFREQIDSTLWSLSTERVVQPSVGSTATDRLAAGGLI